MLKRTGRDVPKRRQPRRKLVPVTADRLREMVFELAPGELIGSLSELARGLGVGIVTVQQAARVLEHEGLLDVRRGPGGGYYGRRPDEETLERSLAAYMRMHPASLDEALDMTSLLFNELIAAAAGCDDARLHSELAMLRDAFGACEDEVSLGDLELRLQELLFQMVDRPLFELLTRVTLRFVGNRGGLAVHPATGDLAAWKAGRQRIIGAVLARDQALARFEANRSNREVVMREKHPVVIS